MVKTEIRMFFKNVWNVKIFTFTGNFNIYIYFILYIFFRILSYGIKKNILVKK